MTITTQNGTGAISALVSGLDTAKLCAENAALKVEIKKQQLLINKFIDGRPITTREIGAVAPEIRFWWRVSKGGDNECWLWKGMTSGGYGRFSIGGKKVRAHRYSLFLATGIMPEDKSSCHTCDNPVCVNPSHLYWGSIDENNKERAAKGRSCKGNYHRTVHNVHLKFGEEHPLAKMTNADARKLKDMIATGRTLNSIAEETGASKSTLSKIKQGIQWTKA